MAPPAVVTPGNLDGVHLGHRALLSATRSMGEAQGLRTVAMFFDPHPMTLLSPDSAPSLLTTASRRTELLRAAGVDEAVAQPFDRGFAGLEPRAFVERLLVTCLGAEVVVVGPDFRFGRDRAGDTAMLSRLGDALGYALHVIEPIRRGGERVSSTRIRALLGRGDLSEANQLLGRAHDVDGTVARGDGRGRTLGFPTANLECDPVLLPADGVYAVRVRRLDAPDAEPLRGVANLGVRPTFAAGRSVEVHLLAFEGDLYGARLRVAFVERVRGERSFDSPEALQQQISADVQQATRALGGAPREWLRWL